MKNHSNAIFCICEIRQIKSKGHYTVDPIEVLRTEFNNVDYISSVNKLACIHHGEVIMKEPFKVDNRAVMHFQISGVNFLFTHVVNPSNKKNFTRKLEQLRLFADIFGSMDNVIGFGDGNISIGEGDYENSIYDWKAYKELLSTGGISVFEEGTFIGLEGDGYACEHIHTLEDMSIVDFIIASDRNLVEGYEVIIPR
jgi:hypothetical protein